MFIVPIEKACMLLEVPRYARDDSIISVKIATTLKVLLHEHKRIS
jgi:hypothetical protein